MLRIELDLADNPIGADPKVGLYKAINRKYASYELSLTNSKIIDLRSYSRSTDPRLTRVVIQHNTTFEYYEFYYSRFDLNEYISNPFWTPSDQSALSKLKNSLDLVKMIGSKVGLNLNDDTHWVDQHSLNLAGGSVTPNFSLRSLYNSVYFVGDQVVWLYVDSPEPVTV